MSASAPPSTAAAGYSGTPLAKKLGITAGARVYVAGAPAGYRALLAPLPPAVRFVRQPNRDTGLAHLFVTERRALGAALPRLRKALAPHVPVWVSWPKKASGQGTDITEDTVRELALPLGFVDIKVCAVDATWSGLKLVVRRELRQQVSSSGGSRSGRSTRPPRGRSGTGRG